MTAARRKQIALVNETSNAKQSEDVCHERWRFTLHSQGMNAYTILIVYIRMRLVPCTWSV